jgi:hypothetical protein
MRHRVAPNDQAHQPAPDLPRQRPGASSGLVERFDM